MLSKSLKKLLMLTKRLAIRKNANSMTNMVMLGSSSAVAKVVSAVKALVVLVVVKALAVLMISLVKCLEAVVHLAAIQAHRNLVRTYSTR